MKKLKAIILICFFSTIITNSYSQDLHFLSSLNSQINESSGLLYLNSHLITHNDSGNENELYEIDTLTGNIIRTIHIINATNTDWEDICMDNNYIYIGDFGNNNGDRTDLKVYKISKNDFLNSDTVYADSINFSYADQVDFTSSNYNTNFDAEAIISYHDSLYIFTKNWIDFNSNIYSLAKDTGTYSIIKQSNIAAQALVTSACYDSSANIILLLGYTIAFPNPSSKLILIDNFNGSFNNCSFQFINLNIPATHSFQFESICKYTNNKYFVSSEEYNSFSSNLYYLDLTHLSVQNSIIEKTSIYPNPAQISFKLNCNNFKYAEIYNNNLVFINTYTRKYIDISTFTNGIYHIIIYDKNNNIYYHKLLKND